MAREGAASGWLDELFKRNDQAMESIAPSIRQTRNNDREAIRLDGGRPNQKRA